MELAYPVSERVVISAGYRYIALGSFGNELFAPQPAGNLALDFDAHELHTAVRVRFWSVRFPRGLFQSSRRRYEP